MRILSNLTLLAVLASSAAAQPCVKHLGKLIDPDGGYQNNLGWSAAVSVDLTIGGSPGDGTYAFLGGSASIFRQVGGAWIPDGKIGGSEILPGDRFGYAVDIQPGVAIVGAQGDDQLDIDAGAAYVFRHNGFGWAEETKLVASDGAWQDAFGRSVSISGSRVVVGAPLDDDNGSNSGSAYVYRFDGTNWIEEAKLVPLDGGADHFFGWSVSVSGTTIAVGAWHADGKAWGSGKVYIFRHDGSAWQQEADLAADDGGIGEDFGHSVSLFGDSLLVGAPGDDDQGLNSGSAYVFRRVGSVWTQEPKIIPATVTTWDQFGRSVSLSGQVAAMDGGIGVAYIYYFDPQAGAWDQIAHLTEPGTLGHSVAASNDTVIAGAASDWNSNGEGAGALHVYELRDRCPADFNGDCVVDTLDVIAFLNAWVNGDDSADLNADGNVDTLDVLLFLNLWSAGC